MLQSRRSKGPRSLFSSVNQPGERRKLRPAAVAAALVAALAASTVSADTLAQPKDNTLERQAANYVRFREDVAAIEAMPFTDEEVTREAHRRLATHDSKALSSGWVAYAALVAADSPAFAEALQEEIDKKSNRRKGIIGGRDGLMAHIAEDPKYLRNLPGADEAMNAILAMAVQDSARITELGDAFKAQAYAMQKTSWGKKRISPPQSRLDEAVSYGRSRAEPATPILQRAGSDGVMAPALASAKQEWAADWGAEGGQGRVSEKNAEDVIDRILNLAARYSTDSLNPRLVEVYAQNPKADRCLSMAQLTLNQCIAATRTPYEEAFCLGEHGLIDVAGCTSWVADAGAS